MHSQCLIKPFFEPRWSQCLEGTIKEQSLQCWRNQLPHQPPLLDTMRTCITIILLFSCHFALGLKVSVSSKLTNAQRLSMCVVHPCVVQLDRDAPVITRGLNPEQPRRLFDPTRVRRKWTLLNDDIMQELVSTRRPEPIQRAVFRRYRLWAKAV